MGYFPGGFEFLDLSAEGGLEGGFFGLKVGDGDFEFGDGFLVLVLGGFEVVHDLFFGDVFVLELLDLYGEAGVVFLGTQELFLKVDDLAAREVVFFLPGFFGGLKI